MCRAIRMHGAQSRRGGEGTLRWRKKQGGGRQDSKASNRLVGRICRCIFKLLRLPCALFCFEGGFPAPSPSGEYWPIVWCHLPPPVCWCLLSLFSGSFIPFVSFLFLVFFALFFVPFWVSLGVMGAIISVWTRRRRFIEWRTDQAAMLLILYLVVAFGTQYGCCPPRSLVGVICVVATSCWLSVFPFFIYMSCRVLFHSICVSPEYHFPPPCVPGCSFHSTCFPFFVFFFLTIFFFLATSLVSWFADVLPSLFIAVDIACSNHPSGCSCNVYFRRAVLAMCISVLQFVTTKPVSLEGTGTDTTVNRCDGWMYMDANISLMCRTHSVKIYAGIHIPSENDNERVKRKEKKTL